MLKAGGRVWITGLLCIIGGVLAASSLILSKRPDAKKALDKIAPFQGIIGVALLGLGIWPSADIATGLVTEGLPPVLLVAAGATALQVVLVMRLWRPPVEHLRLLHMLPLRRTEIRRSKAAYLTLRLLFCVIAPSIPALVRAPESGIEVMGMPIMWVGLGALLISGWLIGLWVGVRSGVSSRTFG